MPDCIVVGGGVIGMLTARVLFEKGLDVLLVERAGLGGESSWAGGGIISPLYPWRYPDAVNRLAERSKQIYPELIDRLYQESGQDAELLTSGLFVLQNEGIDGVLQWGKQWQVEMQGIEGAKAVQALEPSAHASIEAGIWMPEIMQVRNPKLVKALKGSFEHNHIAWREHCPVDEILIANNRLQGVRCGSEKILAECVVIASGAWSAQFLPAGQSVNVEPVKGQMIMFKGPPGLLKRIVLSEGHYVIPRKDGRILAGSTLEQVGFDKTVSAQAQQELFESAIALVPSLAELSVERQWAGLRPGTRSGIPYICQHDTVHGLYIHAGHYRNGIVLGAASAELMAEIIMGQVPLAQYADYCMSAIH